MQIGDWYEEGIVNEVGTTIEDENFEIKIFIIISVDSLVHVMVVLTVEINLCIHS